MCGPPASRARSWEWRRTSSTLTPTRRRTPPDDRRQRLGRGRQARAQHPLGRVRGAVWCCCFTPRSRSGCRRCAAANCPAGSRRSLTRRSRKPLNTGTVIPAQERTRLERQVARDAELLRGSRLLWIDDEPSSTRTERSAPHSRRALRRRHLRHRARRSKQRWSGIRPDHSRARRSRADHLLHPQRCPRPRYARRRPRHHQPPGRAGRSLTRRTATSPALR